MQSVTKVMEAPMHTETEKIRILGITYTHFSLGYEGGLFR